MGAIATQAFANPRYGPEGLALLREGLERRGDRRAPDRRGRRPCRAAARHRRRRRPIGDVHRRGVQRVGGRPRGTWLRSAGEHPRLRGNGRLRSRRPSRATRAVRSPCASSTASTPPRPPAATAGASSRPPARRPARRGLCSAVGFAGRSCASTTTSGRSRSYAGSTISTGRCSSVSKYEVVKIDELDRIPCRARA